MTFWEGLATGGVGVLLLQGGCLYYVVRKFTKNPQKSAQLLMRHVVKPGKGGGKPTGKPLRSY